MNFICVMEDMKMDSSIKVGIQWDMNGYSHWEPTICGGITKNI